MILFNIYFSIFFIKKIFLWIGSDPGYFAAIIALIIGLLGIFREFVINIFIKPKINFIFEKKPLQIYDSKKIEIQSQYYDIKIKNLSLFSLKNIRIKIKSKMDSEWLYLKRPFYAQNPSVMIQNLAPEEDDDFSFGCFTIGHDSNIFHLTTHPIAYEQNLKIHIGENQKYYLQVVADNLPPQNKKVTIINNGWDKGIEIIEN